MAVQLGGATVANIAEVESASKALRVTPRPIDWGSLGIYAAAGTTGTMAAGLAANSPIFSFRWNSANVALIKKIFLSAGSITALAAGVCTFQGFIARSFTASDTAGTNLTPSGNGNKLRTSMGTTLVTDIRISSTATLTAGTRTKDTNPFCNATGSVTNTAGVVLMPPTELFRAQAGDYPLVLAANEGFVIEATVPGTGTWVGSVAIQWEELTAYVP